MLVYQGESLKFSCRLYDDNNQVMSLGGYKISCALRERSTNKLVWSTVTRDDLMHISVSGDVFTFSTSPDATRDLYGTFIFEVKITKISTGEVVIGVASEHVNIAPSLLGQDPEL